MKTLFTKPARLMVLLMALALVATMAHADAGHRFATEPGVLGDALLTLTNPSNDVIEVRIDLWSSRVEDRRVYEVELEANGRTTLTLDSSIAFDRLVAESNNAFEASLVDADNAPVTFATRATTCQGDWTLTCDSSCSLGPFTATGRVEDGDKVFWKLNEPKNPHVAWETVGDLGITATWDTNGGSCPTEVTNSLGHTYTVSISTGGGGGCIEEPCDGPLIEGQ
ncbi:MAG: hypothetical protein AAGD38_06380 [Acidobacteriota bacterium]